MSFGCRWRHLDAQRWSDLCGVTGRLQGRWRRRRGASAAVVCNGTAALEVALVGTPHVITYKTSPLHWRIGNWLVNLEQTAPSNLTLVRTGDVEPVWEEIFQSDATPDALSSRVTQLRSDPSLRQQQLGGSATLRRLLGAGVGVSAVAKAWQG